MNQFYPSYFFSLENFSHKALFEGCTCVWEALPKIETYLHSLPLGKIEGDVSDKSYLVNPELITIGKGSVVEPGAYIKGPCVLGENCVVRHGAYLRGNVLAGDGCVIGHDTEVKNSVFFNGAQAAHFAYVGDSLLGENCNLGAGTKLANLKLDHQQISIRTSEGEVETGLRKFGAIIGDGAQTGCNSVTNPGTLLGKRVRCYACMNVGGFVPSNHIVKNDTKRVTVEIR